MHPDFSPNANRLRRSQLTGENQQISAHDCSLKSGDSSEKLIRYLWGAGAVIVVLLLVVFTQVNHA